MVKLTKIITGDDGQSNFEELELALYDAKYGKLTEVINAKSVIFGEIDEERDVGWHNPPENSIIIMLQGAMEIEIGDGTKKHFKKVTSS